MRFKYVIYPDRELYPFFMEEIRSVIRNAKVMLEPKQINNEKLFVESNEDISRSILRLASASKAFLLIDDIARIHELLLSGFCSRIGHYIPYTIRFLRFHENVCEARKILREIIQMSPLVRVSLNAPQLELDLLPEGLGVRVPVGRDVALSRDPKYRPYAPPATMSSLLSRLLVNLTGLSPGQTFLDPFCGTGSLALEAADMGLKVICIDINPKAIEAAEMLLHEYYGFKEVNLRVGDARHLQLEDDSIDGIATDPPYGISSSTFGAVLIDLYRDFLLEAYRILRSNSRLVICHTQSVPIGKLAAEIGFDYELMFSMKVHSRLTRFISILRAR
ncbi:MAG: methyltransferase domain-containing protein [Candidatus Korarchaeota archaeon]|nr:methyltransferase domain-containing protein [Thermoproteota archaeon]MCR8501000.1 methyltransferase domain-containing protein [Thermoproteota archaeon]